MFQSLFVARGRTVMIDGTPRGPGAVVTLPPAEAAGLQNLGFLQPEPPYIAPPTDPNPSGIGLQNQNAQRPEYRR